MTTDTLRLKSPSELLAIVPYLLGFKPSDSIMVICLEDRTIGLTQRLDLPPAGAGEAVVRSLMPSLMREHPDQVLLIAYENQPDRSAEAVDALTSALTMADIPIHDRIVVGDGRWRSLDCHEPSCCPALGQPVPAPAEVPAMASEFVGHELSPHPNRNAMAAQLEAGPESVSAADVEAAEALHTHALTTVWPPILDARDSAVQLTPAMAASAALSLRDVQVRDGLVAWLTPGTLDPAQFPAEVESLLSRMDREWDEDQPDTEAVIAMNRIQARLIWLCAMLPDEHAAAALTVLACFTWWRGNGALTRAALDRALRCQPEYRLALLLQRMVDLAIRPRANP